MNDLKELVSSITEVLGDKVDERQISIINRGVPHKPFSLPKDKMGIYTFWYKGEALKIGKVGTKSKSRFNSQHYKANSSQSNLAKSILADNEIALNVTEINIKEWIQKNTVRIDIIIDAELGILFLNLFEACLHYKFKPKYEGYKSQK